MSRRGGALAAAAGLACAALAGCGGTAGDVIAIQVSGGPAHANETLVVSNDGRASCNRAALRPITNPELLEARSIAHDAQPLARSAQIIASGGGRQFTLRDADGTVRWAETSTGLPPVLPRAELFALELSREVC